MSHLQFHFYIIREEKRNYFQLNNKIMQYEYGQKRIGARLINVNVKNTDVPKFCLALFEVSFCGLVDISPSNRYILFNSSHYQMYLINEYDRIPIRISVKFVPRSPIDNKPA